MMRRRTASLINVAALLSILFGILLLVTYLLGDYNPSDNQLFQYSQVSEFNSIDTQAWQIPEWVQRYNVSHLFDWTWHASGDFARYRQSLGRLLMPTPQKLRSSIVVNDPLEYLRTHRDEGCVADDVARLPNLIPHPIPRARSLPETCSALNINHSWIFCNRPQSELDRWLPTTTRFVVIAVFNAFVDTGYCHPDVPGTTFTEHATFHLQSWTNRPCANMPIYRIPRTTPKYRHSELINSIGAYLSAPGHFGPQQLPRLLRLLAVAPKTAKVLVAKGGIADALIDVLVERDIVTRDRIISFDRTERHFHFANLVYRSEPWPYIGDKKDANSLHDRTDMQLVHRALSSDGFPFTDARDRVVLIKRTDGDARSLIEHMELVKFINSSLQKSKTTFKLRLEVFEAKGHIRDHIALFRRARIIVGAHGAGMMNVLWAPPNTHVIEIGYDSGMTFPQMYAEMSLHLEQNYWVCKGRGDYGAPIHVDMDDFVFIFSQIIHHIESKR